MVAPKALSKAQQSHCPSFFNFRISSFVPRARSVCQRSLCVFISFLRLGERQHVVADRERGGGRRWAASLGMDAAAQGVSCPGSISQRLPRQTGHRSIDILERLQWPTIRRAFAVGLADGAALYSCRSQVQPVPSRPG